MDGKQMLDLLLEIQARKPKQIVLGVPDPVETYNWGRASIILQWRAEIEAQERASKPFLYVSAVC